MALTIAIEGKGVIANCDSLSNDTGGTGTDDWGELGGGSITDESDAFIYGTTSIGMKYASKSGWTYFSMGTPLDFDTAGSEEGEFIYIWLNIAAPNAFDTLANKGFAVRIGNSTTVYREFIIAGEDDANGWSGGWKLFVVDPTKPGSVSDNGSFDVGAVDYIAIWIDTNASVRAESIFIDQIAIGSGLRITGTWDDSTYPGGAWDEVLAYCTDYTNRAWGMLQERDGILYGFGKFYIGATSQSAVTDFQDSGKVFQFGTSQYYISSAWASTMPTDACGIIVEDASGYATTFEDGIIVGTENGRSGSTFIGNEDQDIIIDLYGGNNAGSLTLCYGTTFKSIKGSFNSGNDSDHKFLSCSFIDCSQFDPVGGPVLRNCIFAETADVDSALLWNENINVQSCNFIANTTGAAIEHPSNAGTPYTHTSLLFSGNTDDVLNSSGSAIVIGNSGDPTSNGSSSEGSAVTFQNNVTIAVTNVVIGSVVRMSTIDGNGDESTNLINEIATGTTVSDSTNYAGLDYTAVVIVVRSSSGTPKYIPYRATDTISTSGISHTANQVEDTIAT